MHLDASRPRTVELFIKFLRDINGIKALYILGDLVEYWLGDDADDGRLNTVFEALRSLHDSGSAVHLMHGNRDFLLGEAFAQRIGASLHREDTIRITLGELNVLLLHGDTLCLDDHGYQQLRLMVRDTQWQTEFSRQKCCRTH